MLASLPRWVPLIKGATRQLSSTFRKGVYAATVTAFKGDGSLDETRTLNLTQTLLRSGCDGVVLLGSTGEANSLSVDERDAFLTNIGRSAQLSADHKSRLIVGTGTCSLPETVRITRSALSAGIDNILMLPPFYYKNVSDDGLYEYFARVIDAISDARLRIILYHFPKMAGVSFSDDLVERLLKGFPGTVCGMKDSSGDREHVKRMCEKFPQMQTFAGSEDYLADAIKFGAAGCISASTTLTCQTAALVYKFATTHRTNPYLPSLSAKLAEQRQAIAKYGFTSAVKSQVARQSKIADWQNIRVPMLRGKEEDWTELECALEQAKCQMSHLHTLS